MRGTPYYSSSFPDGRSPGNGVTGRFKLICLTILVVFIAAVAAHTQDYRVLYRLAGTHGNGSPATAMTQGRDGDFYAAITNGSPEAWCGLYRITTTGQVRLWSLLRSAMLPDMASAPVAGGDGNLYGVTQWGGVNGSGGVVRITPEGVATVLYSFDATGGARPNSLLRGSDGNLYGATGWTIFKITLSGTLTTIYDFHDASQPVLLLSDDDGYFYGATQGIVRVDGVLRLHGSIFKVTPKGQFQTVYVFDGVHGSIPTSLVRADDGYLIGTTTWGGRGPDQYSGEGVIFKLAPNGTVTVLHSFDMTNPKDGYWPHGALVRSNDDFYGTTLRGGTGSSDEDGVIYRISQGGRFEVIHNFIKPDGGNPNGIVRHTNGALYGITDAGGIHGQGVLYRFKAGLKPFVALEQSQGAPGSVVGVLGSEFSGVKEVTFAGERAKFEVVKKTYLKATVPPGATTGWVKVVTAKRTLASDRIFTVRR